MVDVERLKLAFSNIMSNAIRYTFGGGSIKVSLAKHEKYIEVVEDCLGEKIPKTYKYWYLDELIDEHLEETGEDIEIKEE